VREAIRDAIAHFGPPGGEVQLASPATSEAVVAAIRARTRPPPESAKPAGSPTIPSGSTRDGVE
jgi:xanthine dehydrogenase large subunit